MPVPLPKKEGALYSRPKTGTGMPKKERFRHAQFGRASSSVLLSKLPVLSWTAAEAANCWLCVFWSLVLSDASHSITAGRPVQGQVLMQPERRTFTRMHIRKIRPVEIGVKSH